MTQESVCATCHHDTPPKMHGVRPPPLPAAGDAEKLERAKHHTLSLCISRRLDCIEPGTYLCRGTYTRQSLGRRRSGQTRRVPENDTDLQATFYIVESFQVCLSPFHACISDANAHPSHAKRNQEHAGSMKPTARPRGFEK